MPPTCYYELLGVTAQASDDDLKKAYRRQALIWHPDKNPHRIQEATQNFAQIQSAYEMLSDPHERAWYDDHRDAILRGADLRSADPETMASGPTTEVLMKYFNATAFRGFTDTPDGFFAIYNSLFAIIADIEIKNADEEASADDVVIMENLTFGRAGTKADEPLSRQSQSPQQFTLLDFYNFWTGFATRRTFGWHDKYRLSDAPNRMIRRLMEKENRKLRDQAKKEYNDTVRSLALFMRKRDPRIKAWTKVQQEAQRERERQRQLRLEKERRSQQDAIGAYVEPEWAKVDPEKYEFVLDTTTAALSTEPIDLYSDSDEACREPGLPADPEDPNALYCVVCQKRFKSTAQKENHLKSKRHIQALEHLRAELEADDALFDVPHPPFPATAGVNLGPGPSPIPGSTKSKKKKKRQNQLAMDATEQDWATDEHTDKARVAAVVAEIQGLSVADESNINPLSPSNQHATGLPIQSTKASDAEAQSTKTSAKTKRQQRRERKDKAQMGDSLLCNVCRESFTTRNQLFKHIKVTGHALAFKPLPAEFDTLDIGRRARRK
ncbi:hypothetical protein H4R34_001157 [Dimargaris verticillata]|uniref:J domain-containing protein n=1 Tax=Dimargaris verticillata TaxID=2761393 RepID=A0A9W8BAJ1_9FUNG|nr:hypothetical protein H4R34_001157 [Dimargaris verticillata]